QLSRAQRDDQSRRARCRPRRRSQDRSRHGCRHARHLRSRIPSDRARYTASRAGGADSGSVGIFGGAGGERPAHRFVSLQRISACQVGAAPHRLLETLADVVEVLGNDRHVVVAREVTKLHEEFLRGRAREVLDQLKSRGEVKGEITLLIAKAEEGAAASAAETVSLAQRVREIMVAEKADEKAALKKVAKERGIGKSEAYREWQQNK